MPKLADDARYAAALRHIMATQVEATRDFRSRLADRVVMLCQDAITEMGGGFNEDTLRRHLKRLPEVYVEESMRYIRIILVRSGELELAKRLDEVAQHVSLDDLPEPLREGYEELRRTGLIAKVRPPEDGVTQNG